MKLICFTNDVINDSPVYFVKSDNVLLRNNRDFFYPNFSNKIECNLNIIVKISKIGKCVEENFAHRYYNELSIGINFYALDLQKTLSDLKLPLSMSYNFDYSTAIGKKFFFVSDFIENSNMNFFINDKLLDTNTYCNLLEKINKFISIYTLSNTIKIGDYLLIPLSKKNFSLNINDKIFLQWSNLISIKFWVK